MRIRPVKKVMENALLKTLRYALAALLLFAGTVQSSEDRRQVTEDREPSGIVFIEKEAAEKEAAWRQCCSRSAITEREAAEYAEREAAELAEREAAAAKEAAEREAVEAAEREAIAAK